MVPSATWEASERPSVSSSMRPAAPVAVRYAFQDFTRATLFSTEGLPVSSFRTDDWAQ